MTEFNELIKEAPNFNAMERGELVTYAYAMFAAGTKADSENAKLRGARDVWQENDAKLRELVRHLHTCMRHDGCATCEYADDACDFDHDMRELGMEVDE